MAGPFTKLLNTAGAGPMNVPDEVMGPGTRSVIDFRDGYTWPAGVAVSPMPVNADYKTYDWQGFEFDGQPLRTNYAFPVSGGDIAFQRDPGTGRKLILPDVWELRPGIKDFAMSFWLQMAPAITQGYNNRIAGAGTSGGGDLAWELTPVGDSSNIGVDLIWYLKTGAAGWSLASIPGFVPSARIFNSALHRLDFRYKETADGTYFDQFFALDGQLIGTRAAVPKTGNFPAVGAVSDAHIGCPATLVGGAFVGNFRRAIFEDITLTTRDWLELVKLDWEANKSRLGAV